MVGTLPRSVGAQTGEEGTTSEPNLQEPGPSTEPAPGEPALQLELDSAGVEVVQSRHTLEEGWYTPEEMDVREWRQRNGLIGSAVALGLGAVVFGISFVEMCIFPPPEGCPEPSWHRPVRITGGVLMAGGAAGMLVSGILVGVRKGQRRELQEAHYARRRRVQWDVARSRLVF
jgi:hypothetical protein